MVLCLKNDKPEQNVPIQDRAFQYGDGCFTTAKVVNNSILLWSRHQQRLHQHAQQLLLRPNWSCIDQLIEKLQLYTGTLTLNGTLKIIISRGEGQRGYGFSNEQPADLYVLFYPIQQPARLGLSYICADVLQSKIAANVMPQLLGVKSLNRLEQVMLKHEAATKSVPEALVFDYADQLVEGVSSNCFIYIDGHWLTPHLQNNGIAGVMRAEILTRMQEQKIVCQQTAISNAQCQNIESLFFCNALNPMQIATTLGHKTLNIQPAETLFQLLTLDHLS
ncbi:aminodeoxychorismate lyase [Acinetobacter apis]|uniref:Aminodeoxychorismate lyase n=1 Tax=Acinetobacter apis TaxID=1229165 RepID=A0A217EDV0_9GAMM|nr:4-amino-4-deoxychorismate lyase [Acinetobacter apis]